MRKLIAVITALLIATCLCAYPYQISIETTTGEPAGGQVLISTTEYSYAPIEVFDSCIIDLEGELREIEFIPMEGFVFADFFRYESGIVFYVM